MQPTELPHAADKLPDWLEARRRTGRMLVALDFDGTLAPIAADPGDAALPSGTAEWLSKLASRGDTYVAVISGRGLDDIEQRVGLAGLYYAGNHGMQIRGPGIAEEHQAALDARHIIASCAAELSEVLPEVPGAQLENKGLTLSLHYRQVVDPRGEARLREAVTALGRHAGIRLTEGKKVLEVRPDVDWDKGSAVNYLVATLLDGSDSGLREEMTEPPVLFIGDDVTDEDGFRQLRGRGDGILVGPVPAGGTAATLWLSSTDEVADLIRELALGQVIDLAEDRVPRHQS